jgi:hypothetical protein
MPRDPDPVPGKDRPLRGHAIRVVGYDDDRELVRFKDSWGEGRELDKTIASFDHWRNKPRRGVLPVGGQGDWEKDPSLVPGLQYP